MVSAAMEKYPALWLKKYGMKTEKGLPLEYEDHRFMLPIINAMATEPLICAIKGAQITFTTTATLASFWVGKHLGVDQIYTLPTADDRNQFVGDKVNRLIAQNPILQSYTKDKDTIEQKQIGGNLIHYRGTFTQKAAMMVSSDINYYDEVDASDQKVIEQYSTRLQHSKLKWERWFSHPSVPETGVDIQWQRSDRRHWLIKCSHCNERQFLELSSIDNEKEIFKCKKCGGEIYDNNRRNGEWIAEVSGKPIVGFWIPLLICPWVSARDICNYKRTKSEEYFYNKVLGLPYAGSGTKLTKEALYRNLTPNFLYPDRNERIVVGVDTGLQLHYVMGGNKGLPFYGAAEDYDELDSIAQRWPKSVFVIDQGGDIIGSRKFKEKWKGRVWLCSYGEDRKTDSLYRWNDDDHSCITDRNRSLTLLVQYFEEQRIPLQGTKEDWYDYWLHWNNLTKVKDEDSHGRIKYVWARNGDDHWAHATNYWATGMSRFGDGEMGGFLQPQTMFTQGGLQTDKGFQVIKAHKPIQVDWRNV
jgi:hypothetical protein